MALPYGFAIWPCHTALPYGLATWLCRTSLPYGFCHMALSYGSWLCHMAMQYGIAIYHTQNSKKHDFVSKWSSENIFLTSEDISMVSFLFWIDLDRSWRSEHWLVAEKCRFPQHPDPEFLIFPNVSRLSFLKSTFSYMSSRVYSFAQIAYSLEVPRHENVSDLRAAAGGALPPLPPPSSRSQRHMSKPW